MILAGDVGGTKTNLALFEARDSRLCERRAARFESHGYAGLAEIVEKFLAAGDETVERAAFGIAGPVVRGRSEATNLSWIVDAAELEERLGIAPLLLVNDLVATAAGLLDLPANCFRTIVEGQTHERGTRAVLAPGTGLGEAGLIWDGESYHPLPSEGGHADFAPRNETEIALLVYLLERQERVSYEHVLGGPGLSRIYDFLRETGRESEPPELAERLARAEDRNAAISAAALEGGPAIARRTQEIWAAILGAEAGNLALRALSIGGLFLGGGIVVKVIRSLEGEAFRAAYHAKQPLDDLVRKIPVRVVMNDRAALLGAARIGFESRRATIAGPFA